MMSTISSQTYLLLAAGIAMAVAGFFLTRSAKRACPAEDGALPRSVKLKGKLGKVLQLAGSWLFVVQVLPLFFGSVEKKAFSVEISPERVNIAGLSISQTVITTWIAMAIVLFGAVLIRLLVIPKMKNTPTGIQNVLELAIEGISKYTRNTAGNLGENLSAYLFTVAALLIACAVVELFGVRAPTADITMTLALALITFILINYYGIKKKGIGGRIKALADPMPVVLVLRVISDIAIPISMACRLFGNMLGGMIVMELLYFALGNSAVGIPSVIGLYFNVFHPLIQAFIFITLTLTFINEAIE